MTPLRIEWGLVTPIVMSGQPIHLDALIAYAKTEQQLRLLGMDSRAARRQESIRTLAESLPLQKATQGEEWVWMASAIRPCENSTHAHGMRFWTRKSDPMDIAKRYASGEISLGNRPKPGIPAPMKRFALEIHQVRGVFKNMYKFYPIKSIRKVEAFCIGDRSEIEELLQPDSGFVQSLGPRGRIGHGLIGSFTITEDPVAIERWQERVLPWQIDGTVPMQLAVRPPYWAVENRRHAFASPDLFI